MTELLTHELLRVINSPFLESTNVSINTDLNRLYIYAKKNRMPLLYLNSIKELDIPKSLENEYIRLINMYGKTEKGLKRILKLLNKYDIDYTFFKSIKPYKESTVDIDILIFGSDYNKVINVIRDAGYIFRVTGPLSTTFRDKEACLDLDVYDEVGVSNIIYVDKDILKPFVRTKNFFNNNINILTPEADLLSIIGHSVIKEQMYVLSEYYITLYYLFNMKIEDLNSFIHLVNKSNLCLTVKTHIGITALLHYKTHKNIPKHFLTLLNTFGVNSLEMHRFIKMGYKTPYKYHPITIIKSLLEKFKEKKTRKGFAKQIIKMFNPKFSMSFFSQLLHHILRETY